jgi:hypothetical protein
MAMMAAIFQSGIDHFDPIAPFQAFCFNGYSPKDSVERVNFAVDVSWR